MIRLNRRNFMMSSIMLASLGARHALSQGRAPRRHTLTFGFRSSEMRMATVSEPTTFFMTAPLEAPAEAIRIGIGNVSGRPLKIDGICCCEGSGWQPIAGSKWAYLKFRDPQSDGATDPAREPQACIVPPNSVANVPSILWSDWMSYQTFARPRPQMLFRALVPPQELPLNYWVSPGNVGRWLPGAPVRQIEIKPISGDSVSDPGAMMEPSTLSRS